MSSHKQKIVNRPASKDHFGRIRRIEKKSRFHWRYTSTLRTPGDLLAALDEELPDFRFSA